MSCIRKLQLKPRAIAENVNGESKCHKAKVVGWSAFMTVVAGVQLSYFSGVLFRANQIQKQAMAGQLEWNEYIPYTSDYQMLLEIQQDILETKSQKDLKYIAEGWTTVAKTDDLTGGVSPSLGGNGDPSDPGFYTQTDSISDYSQTAFSQYVNAQKTPVASHAQLYEQWETMHSPSVSWFDTAGCRQPAGLKDENGFLGKINNMMFIPAPTSFFRGPGNNQGQSPTGWWVGAPDALAPTNPRTAATDWSTDLMMQPGTSMQFADDMFTRKRSIENTIELLDCDLDCQANGSQLTVVAALNVARLVVVFMVGLFGMLGGWRSHERIAATYCGFFSFLFQLIILIVSTLMVLTPFAMSCFASMQPTGDGMWTMHDDYTMIIGLVIAGYLQMFIFFVISMCGAYRANNDVDTKP